MQVPSAALTAAGNVPPRWSALPVGTHSFALIVDVERAVAGHVLASATLVARYARR